MSPAGRSTHRGATALDWGQVRAWRLARQHLADGRPAPGVQEAAADSVGIHAQVASSAEDALRLRVPDAGAADVRRALWTDRTLVRTWAMRGTLHLLPASEYAALVAALATRDGWRRGSWLRMVGLSRDQVEALIHAIDAALAGRTLTREELADAVGDAGGPAMRRHLLSGWGSLLKPAAYHGVLCSGPMRGRSVTFVRPADWLGRVDVVEPREGLRHVCRRYLHAYGPATHQDFAAWWGTTPGPARDAFGSLRDELAPVQVEGRPAWALRDDVPAMRDAGRDGSVRLLPGFDPYVMGSAPRTSSVPEEHRARVSRASGWISPVVLQGGVAVGVWRASRSREGTTVVVEPFGRLARGARAGIRREAERLSGRTGGPVGVRFSPDGAGPGPA